MWTFKIVFKMYTHNVLYSSSCGEWLETVVKRTAFDTSDSARERSIRTQNYPTTENPSKANVGVSTVIDVFSRSLPTSVKLLNPL